MVNSKQLDPQHADYKALQDSTVIHIRGLKLQMAVAYATLETAKINMDLTKTKEGVKCESTKTETKD